MSNLCFAKQGLASSLSLAAAISLVIATGCDNGLHRIDRRVELLLTEATDTLGPDAARPDALRLRPDAGESFRGLNERPITVNPTADELAFTPLSESADVIARLQEKFEPDAEPLLIDLPFAIAQATGSAREYLFAEEDYVLSALRLLVERHLWGPRFFDEVTALVTSEGSEGGLYDTSLRLVNEFRVTQRLPYGGEVSAIALARATEDLHHRVAGEEVQDASVLLRADVPLLRGAGTAAREDRIQAERDLIYAARDFEQFRRDFVVEIADDFLSLVVQQQAVANAERQVARLKLVENRERTLYEAGRTPRFQAALAEQSTVRAQDDLNQRRESYQLAVDRFKLRLGLPIEQSVVIVPSDLEIPVPDVDVDQSVRNAMVYRLDLQTQRDQVDDARRLLDVARNDMLPDLNLTGTAGLITDPTRERGGVDFDFNESSYSAGLSLGIPLDREIERINIRRAQIELERTRRDLEELRDAIAIEVRSAARDIERALFTLEIQERSIAIGQQRIASIEAAPDRATARDASDAANELARAQDRRDDARRDLRVAVLRYLLATGELRVDQNGFIRPLKGMEFDGRQPLSIPELPPLQP